MKGPMRTAVEAALRANPNWREHPEHAGTYRQWQDLRVSDKDLQPGDSAGAYLPTDLAMVREMAYEARDGDG